MWVPWFHTHYLTLDHNCIYSVPQNLRQTVCHFCYVFVSQFLIVKPLTATTREWNLNLDWGYTKSLSRGTINHRNSNLPLLLFSDSNPFCLVKSEFQEAEDLTKRLSQVGELEVENNRLRGEVEVRYTGIYKVLIQIKVVYI